MNQTNRKQIVEILRNTGLAVMAGAMLSVSAMAETSLKDEDRR